MFVKVFNLFKKVSLVKGENDTNEQTRCVIGEDVETAIAG
jgi:hypothetical protein